MKMKKPFLFASVTVAALGMFALSATVSAGTLQDVQKRGELKCGVNVGLPGISAPDEDGHWSGIDAAFCRSVATARLGDHAGVEFVPVTAKRRFTALQTAAVVMLARTSTWTLTGYVELGVDFVGVLFYDGKGFPMAVDYVITKIEKRDRDTICVLSGT